METPGYYAIIPAAVRYDENLKPNAKLLYGEITALCNATGVCTARNDYFANLYQVSVETISRWISQLRDRGFIDVEILQNQNNLRKISIDKKINRYCQKDQEVLTKRSRGLDKKINSIKENITINNTINREKGALNFLETQFPTRYESEMMKYKTQIGTDFEKFSADFDATVIIEKLEWDVDVLISRLGKYARNWIENINKKQNLNGVQISQPAMQGGNRIEVKRRG